MLAPGSELGRYEIQRKLGRGGMGTVYVAHDPVLGRMVAIKVFQNDLELPDATERFTREARSAAALSHANIVTIYDFGDYDSRPYLAMEYIQGETLAEIIRRKAPLSLVDKLRWLEELCAGVSYAHRIGVVHRDIKPTNLMIDRSGRLKVLDFGIAKIMGAFGSSATALVGTPGYMAPEQITGGTVDHRADIFSTAVVAYELLAYAEAFPGENTHAITHKILTQDAMPLGERVAGIPADLVTGIERALKKSPADRYGDAEEFRVMLARVRRRVESDSGVVLTPTVLAPRASVGGPRPPTGTDASASEQATLAAVTPPPPRRPTDRDSLARRRAAQIEAALARSRAALHRGELEAAADECLQALTLDDTHTAAIELEAMIKVATAKQHAAALLAEARQELTNGALTGAQHLLSQARELDPDATDLRSMDRDLRLARAEQERLRQRAEAVRTATHAAESALQRADVEAALAMARQALELEPADVRARAVEAEALRALDDLTGAGFPETVIPPAAPGASGAAPVVGALAAATPTMVAPAGRGTPAPGATRATDRMGPQPAATAGRSFTERIRIDTYVAASRTYVSGMVAGWRARPAKQQRVVAGIAAGVVLLAAVGTGVALMPAAAPAMGAVVIDATPYATVTLIERADGTRVDLPPMSVTPLSLTLPVGAYRIHLIGPSPGDESRLATVDVHADGTAVPAIPPFRALTPVEYFEQYLSSGVEPVPAAEPGTGASDVAVDPAPGVNQ